MVLARRAWLGLGANLGEPALQLHSALRAIAQLGDCRLTGCSGFYRSAAMTMPQDKHPQPDYCNAVARVETGLSAQELLAQLLAIETAHGRLRQQELRWQPRTLDLDLLWMQGEFIDEPGLQIPHPGLAQRDFVLQPWCDLDPQLEIPGLGCVQSLNKLQSGDNRLPKWAA